MLISKEYVLLNKTGLHARPASNLIKILNKFKSDVKITFNGKEANGKSFISVVGLGAGNKAKVKFIVDGEDAEETIEAIEELINNKFGEE